MLASITALLMTTVGSSAKVVQILEGVTVARFDFDLSLGAALNPGVLMASLVIFFSIAAALLCVINNRLSDRSFGLTLTSVGNWLATVTAFVFFALALALAFVLIALAVEADL